MEEFDHRLKAAQYDEAARLLDTIDENCLQAWGLFKTVISMRERLSGAGRLADAHAIQSNLGNLALMCRRVGRLDESVDRFMDTMREIRRAIREIRSGSPIDEQADRTGKVVQLRKAEDKWLCELGNTWAAHAEMAKAVVCYRRGLRIAEHVPDRPGQARLLGNLAIVHRQLGDPSLAIAFYDQALAIDQEMLAQARDAAERITALRWRCLHLGNSAKPFIAVGDLAKAAAVSEEAIQLAREHGFFFWEAFFHEHYGEIEVLRGDFPVAVERFRTGIEILEAKDEFRSTSYLQDGLGGAYHFLGDLAKARAFYEGCQKLNVPETRYRCEVMLGLLDLEEGQSKPAAEHLCEGIARCRELLRKTPRFYEAAYRAALALLGKRESEAALKTYATAKGLCAAAGVCRSAIQELALLRRAAPDTPRLDEAERILNAP